MQTLVRLRCRDCGYGVSARAAPEACPMCRGTEWEIDRWRPFGKLLGDLRPGRRVAETEQDQRRPR